MSFEELEHRDLLSATPWQGEVSHRAPVGHGLPTASAIAENVAGSDRRITASAQGGATRWAAAVDDVFENNDSLYQAANLGSLSRPASFNNLVMADRHDWYQFQMNGPGNAADYVGISFQHVQGDLDLAVYNAAGRRVGLSNGVTNSERVSLDGSGCRHLLR